MLSHICTQNSKHLLNCTTHFLQRAKLIPDGSPFGLKMETYLRMADIKYENDFKYPSSPKGE